MSETKHAERGPKMNYKELQRYMCKKRKDWFRAALSHLSCLIRIGASEEAIQLAVWQAQSYAKKVSHERD